MKKSRNITSVGDGISPGCRKYLSFPCAPPCCPWSLSLVESCDAEEGWTNGGLTIGPIIRCADSRERERGSVILSTTVYELPVKPSQEKANGKCVGPCWIDGGRGARGEARRGETFASYLASPGGEVELLVAGVFVSRGERSSLQFRRTPVSQSHWRSF